MSRFSKTWKSSPKPRKQRKYLAEAPKHLKSKMLMAHLSEELAKKYNKRNARVRKGDRVKIMRGQFKKRTGKVAKVSLYSLRAYVEGIEFVKKDGSKVMYPMHPSNFMITELNLDDKERKKKLDMGKGTIKGESKNG